jgi:protein-L-isoaspartate(D-aspartate) O-methyltransferase
VQASHHRPRGVRALLAPLFFGAASTAAPDFARLREAMVRSQLEARDITDARVLRAFRDVPRHLFVPEPLRRDAYADRPLPIGAGQTISQPYIVALMSQALRLSGDEKVLEIGTGSGYQAAILARLARQVFSIEIVPSLAQEAAARLRELGCANVRVRAGDGYRGWPEEAPFDAIVVTCAPEAIPQPLLDQLAEGGRLVIPVGEIVQDLVLVEKRNGKLVRSELAPVRFVPMTGEAEKR